MIKLFRKKERVKAQNMLKPMEVNFDRIDAYVLRKYGLTDIEKKDVFILLNLLFMTGGIISILSFLYKSVNPVAVIAGLFTAATGFTIFRRVKKYGKKITEKEENQT